MIVGLTLEQQVQSGVSATHDQPELYCFCQQPEHGKMTMCENSLCVGIKWACKGSWYCRDRK